MSRLATAANEKGSPAAGMPRRSPRLYAVRVAGDSRPGYRLIAATLAARIAAGDYPLQSKLPGKRDLAAEFGVAVTTMERALRALADDGLVQPSRGAGTYVVSTEPQRPKTDRERITDLERRMEQAERRLDER